VAVGVKREPESAGFAGRVPIEWAIVSDSVPTKATSGLSRLLGSFRAPGFKLFFTSTTFAAVDMNVRMAIHGWLVLELTDDSAFWVGIFAFILGLGQVLFSLVAGAIVDRFQRRSVLLAEGTLSAAVAWGLAAAVYYGVAGLPVVMAAASLMGCQRALRFTATNRMVYDIVGPRHLVNGVALWRVSATPMMIFGAVLAGVLIDLAGIWAAYAFMGFSLLLGLIPLSLIRVRGNVERTGITLLKQTLDGLKLISTNRSLRTLFTVSVVMEGLGFAFLVMIPVVAKTVLHVGGTGFGLLQAGVGVGMLFSAVFMAANGDAKHKPTVIFVCALAGGLAMIGFAISHSLPLSMLMAATVMALLNAYDLTLGALMQLVSPPNMRGRAVSLHSLAISFTALGGFVMGVGAGLIGVPIVLAISGGGIFANALGRRGALMRIEERSGVE